MLSFFNNLVEIGSVIAGFLSAMGDFFLTPCSSFLDIQLGWHYNIYTYLGNTIKLSVENGNLLYTLFHPLIAAITEFLSLFGYTNPVLGVCLIVLVGLVALLSLLTKAILPS